jgi:hypothetical protein
MQLPKQRAGSAEVVHTAAVALYELHCCSQEVTHHKHRLQKLVLLLAPSAEAKARVSRCKLLNIKQQDAHKD